MGDQTRAPRRGSTKQDDRSGTAERVAEARTQMARALSLEGFVSDGLPVCPQCHKAQKGKSALFDDGGFKCHACGFYAFNAVDFLTQPRVRRAGQLIGQARDVGEQVVLVRNRREELTVPVGEVELEGGKWPFALAVDALLGADVPHPEGRTPVLEAIEVKPSFTATPDPALYARVLELGSVDAAQAFFGRWGIDADVVARFRTVRLTLTDAELVKALRRDFSPEQLIASGLATPEGYMLVNQRYPVIEPHVLPDGRVAGMQFRGSEDVEAQVAAHKAFKARRDAAEAAGEPFNEDKVAYVPKFLSLNGATAAQQCGLGLENLQRLVDLGDPSQLRKVWVVEGFKDVLAGETMGMTCYGLPGAGKLPVRAVCSILSRFDEVRVALDGDDAGREGRQRLLRHFADHGVHAVEHPPPAGMDICDVLMSKLGR